jgi:chemotaxis protein MotB
MFKKIVSLLFAASLVMAISGCMVMKDTYMKKVNEADELSKNLAAEQQKNKDLTAQNTGLKKQLATTTAEKEELNNVLNAKSDELSRRNAALRAENEELKKTKEKVQQVSKTYESMLKKMESEVAKGQVTITELKGKLTVNMVDAILFDSGESEVKKQGQQVLEKLVDVLKDVQGKVIRVEGHTDNIQIHGNLAKKYPTNWELSAARATNVTRYLQKAGIDPAMLSTAAYGEFRPVAPNDTKEGRAKNRRIEIVLVNKE